MTARKERNLARALKQQRESRIARLVEAGMIKSAAEIPEDALPAVLELQNPQGTWSPPLFYRDMGFRCEDCGKDDVWHEGVAERIADAAGGRGVLRSAGFASRSFVLYPGSPRRGSVDPGLNP